MMVVDVRHTRDETSMWRSLRIQQSLEDKIKAKLEGERTESKTRRPSLSDSVNSLSMS